MVLPEPDGPEQGQELAARHVEVEVAHDQRLAVIGLLHVDELNVRLVGHANRLPARSRPAGHLPPAPRSFTDEDTGKLSRRKRGLYTPTVQPLPLTWNSPIWSAADWPFGVPWPGLKRSGRKELGS